MAAHQEPHQEGIMICQACRTGAGWNELWRRSHDKDMLDFADGMHRQCEGCDCQHATGLQALGVLPL